MRGALSYNERKVSQGKAEMLLASGFSCNIEQLGFSQKLRRFQFLTDRNEKVKTNTLHLSVNFPPDEFLSDERMREIAMDYMDKIGFGGQPFLVYKHKDAKHPHFHVVTTNVQHDGSYISFHNLGKERSEPARKAIELQFGLIAAETRKKESFIPNEDLPISPAEYGKHQIKHTITNIVGNVVQNYKFSSFEEFNIILRQYNILADRGLPTSQRYQTGGLVYSLIDKDGFKEGQGIKASEIYEKPTLNNLERKFSANGVKKAGTLLLVKKSVSSSLDHSRTIREFANQLKKKNILLHFDQDRLGIIRQIYFVDHRQKTVFSQHELGITPNDIYRLRAAGSQVETSKQKNDSEKKFNNPQKENTQTLLQFGTISIQGLMYALLKPEYGSAGPGWEIPRKRKKRRKGPSL